MENKEKEQGNYRTKSITIDEKHNLFSYCKQTCENSKNLYNATNFHIRQIHTGLTTEKALQPLQMEVLMNLRVHIDSMNETQQKASES